MSDILAWCELFNSDGEADKGETVQFFGGLPRSGESVELSSGLWRVESVVWRFGSPVIRMYLVDKKEPTDG